MIKKFFVNLLVIFLPVFFVHSDYYETIPVKDFKAKDFAIGSCVKLNIYYKITNINAHILALGPNEQFAIAKKKTIEIRSLRNVDQPLFILKGHTADITSMQFSTDGKLLISSSHDGTVRIWNLTTNNTSTLRYENSIYDIACSIDNKFILVAHHDGASFCNLETGESKELSGHKFGVSSVAISADGKSALTAGGYDYSAKLWNLETLKCLDITGHRGYVCKVLFSNDNKYAITASRTKTIIVCRLSDLKTFNIALNSIVHDIQLSQNKESLFICTTDNTIIKFNLLGWIENHEKI